MTNSEFTSTDTPLIGIIMGSDSDMPTMIEAATICKQFDVPYEMHIVSAHRTPDDMANYGKNAHLKGIKVIIAGAGGAAHLPGMTAAYSPLPVIGVPIQSKALGVQMPAGVPVATVAIGGAKNAGLLAIQILSVAYPFLLDKMCAYKHEMAMESRAKNSSL